MVQFLRGKAKEMTVVSLEREDLSREVLHGIFLKIYELESLNIVASNRWREDDGSFRNEDMREEYVYELMTRNRERLVKLLSDTDAMVSMYPAFVVLPLLRAFGALTVRVLHGMEELDGALLSVWKVQGRLEPHTATDEQAENGWAVIRSVWTILMNPDARDSL